MKRLCFIVLALACLMAPAHAHLLRVFATVEGDVVSGYGFFIGGGRPEEATLIIASASGQELYRGKTDDRGAYSWQVPAPQALTVTIDTGEGHIAHANLTADRFGGTATAESQAGASSGQGGSETTEPASGQTAGTPASVPANLNDLIATAVDKAVARQVRPLMEAFAAAESRARFTDIVGGFGMIFGLAGMAMWIVARRRLQSGSRPADDNEKRAE